jgi:transcriptional regulator with XRE-family HTH domain
MTKTVDDTKKRYRNNVLTLRLRAGIAKQKDFAERLGIAPQVLSEIESNRRFLSAPYALRISEELGCRLDDLFEPVPQSGAAVS